MRAVSLGPQPPLDDVQATLRWLVQSMREIENASGEEPIAVADSYSSDIPATPTRQVNVTSPTAANLAAVLASFIADLQRRGINKSG
jgi:hypothetical protein